MAGLSGVPAVSYTHLDVYKRQSQIYDVLVRGHSHIFEVSRHGKTLLVNPGEIWGHLTGFSTAAILDTSSLEVERVDLGRHKTYREIIKG